MEYTLNELSQDEDWLAYNTIRKAELFADCDYNPFHPDEYATNNHPLLLRLGTAPIGTVRLDFANDIATLRLVAITKDKQGKGHGKNFYRLIEEYAHKNGVKKLQVNAAPEAVGYYSKMGFVEETWDIDELQGIAEQCIQMTKNI